MPARGSRVRVLLCGMCLVMVTQPDRYSRERLDVWTSKTISSGQCVISRGPGFDFSQRPSNAEMGSLEIVMGKDSHYALE